MSSYYGNPRKGIHTLFNWHNIVVSDNNLNNMEYIGSLKQQEVLAAAVQKAFLEQGITLTRDYKEFADVFACTEPEINPILIVVVAKVHELYKLNKVGTPQTENFTVLLLLFQTEPHVCLPFLDTNSNLHLGKMIRNRDYKTNGTFDKYMRKNVDHKLVPIQNKPPGNHTVEQVLHLKAYYITSLPATSAA